MTDSLRPYPEYKDPGVDWLGEIPAHWEVYPHRSLFTEIIERDCPDEQMLSVTIARGVLPQSQLLASSSKKDSSNTDKSNYKLVSEGDITYNKMRAWQGAIGASAYRGIISPAYIVVRLRNEVNKPWYFHYLFRTPRFTTEAERWSYGITSDQWSLRYGEFKQIYSPLPPPDEQAAIVTFLDAAEKRIRRYIRAKQKLIKLLNEQKQAIIQQAVTRGLNPDAPMKDSGVEWLGEVPAHWEVWKISHVFKTATGSTPSRGKSSYYDGAIPWVKTGELKDGEIFNTSEYISESALKETALTLLPAGTLLIAMYGQGQTRGRTGLLRTQATTNQACFAILPNESKALPKYIQYWFISAYLHLRFISDARSSTQPNLNGQMLNNERIAIPSISEQEEILNLLASELEAMEELIQFQGDSITLIREYRTRLIADVVTGKVDVRGLAFEMPEAFEDDDLLDVDEGDLLEEEEGDMELEADD
jgi:type I restriction enzyme S subunit